MLWRHSHCQQSPFQEGSGHSSGSVLPFCHPLAPEAPVCQAWCWAPEGHGCLHAPCLRESHLQIAAVPRVKGCDGTGWARVESRRGRASRLWGSVGRGLTHHLPLSLGLAPPPHCACLHPSPYSHALSLDCPSLWIDSCVSYRPLLTSAPSGLSRPAPSPLTDPAVCPLPLCFPFSCSVWSICSSGCCSLPVSQQGQGLQSVPGCGLSASSAPCGA